MKIEHTLLTLVIIFSFLLGGLCEYTFLHRDGKITRPANVVNFQSPPDSVVPKIGTVKKGTPDKVSVVKNKPEIPCTNQPGTTLTEKPVDTTPYGEDYGETQEIASYKTFEDSSGIYLLTAIADCAVKEFRLETKHKPQTMQEVNCSQMTTFLFGTLTGTVLTIIFEAVIYYFLVK